MTMTDIEHARRQIDEHILGVMFSGYIPEYGVCETFHNFSAFETPGLTRDIVRGALRDLTDKGLCRYRSGLWSEDGEVAGAGYGLTGNGVDAYLALSGRERPQGMGEWWRERENARLATAPENSHD
jgi:hypothetical protein